MKRLMCFLFALCISLPAALPAHAATLTSGSLIKAAGPAVYYYADDGKRYVFPNEKTYKTWYVDFSTVQTITDSELAAIQIGGNVTYRPGIRLTKITTDPKVYAVEGNQLRWVATEALAIELFGANWATQVDDIPDAFFVNYTVGTQITASSDYVPATVRDAFKTIQSVLTATPQEPNEPTEPTDDIALTLTLNKTEAQVYEQVDLLAQTNNDMVVQSLVIKVDGDGQLTSCVLFSCSTTWNVPSTDTQSTYTFRAILTLTDGRTKETTATLTVIDTPTSPYVRVTSYRLMLKPNQFPNIRAIVEPQLVSAKTTIYINDVSVKVCTSTPTPCEYGDYLTGDIGTTYIVYATVQTGGLLNYKSEPITITIAENDTPLIEMTPSATTIAPGESVTMTVRADDDDGISKMEILLNGELVKSCLGAAPCEITTGPWTTSNTTLAFTANAWDLNDAQSSASLDVFVE